MKTHNSGIPPQTTPYRQEALRLLVLVPHAEIRRRMHQFSAELFAAGMAGAWSFPHAAPLAVLSQALNPPELKQCAALLRSHNTVNNGKIKSRDPVYTAFPREFQCNPPCELDMDIYGPEPDCAIPDSLVSAVGGKALYWFSPVVLGAAIAERTACIGGHDDAAGRIRPPELSFRAAGLANMIYIPLPEAVHSGSIYSYKWKIERLHWLPQSTRRNNGLSIPDYP